MQSYLHETPINPYDREEWLRKENKKLIEQNLQHHRSTKIIRTRKDAFNFLIEHVDNLKGDEARIVCELGQPLPSFKGTKRTVLREIGQRLHDSNIMASGCDNKHYLHGAHFALFALMDKATWVVYSKSDDLTKRRTTFYFYENDEGRVTRYTLIGDYYTPMEGAKMVVCDGTINHFDVLLDSRVMPNQLLRGIKFLATGNYFNRLTNTELNQDLLHKKYPNTVRKDGTNAKSSPDLSASIALSEVGPDSVMDRHFSPASKSSSDQNNNQQNNQAVVGNVQASSLANGVLQVNEGEQLDSSIINSSSIGQDDDDGVDGKERNNFDVDEMMQVYNAFDYNEYSDEDVTCASNHVNQNVANSNVVQEAFASANKTESTSNNDSAKVNGKFIMSKVP